MNIESAARAVELEFGDTGIDWGTPWSRNG